MRVLPDLSDVFRRLHPTAGLLLLILGLSLCHLTAHAFRLAMYSFLCFMTAVPVLVGASHIVSTERRAVHSDVVACHADASRVPSSGRIFKLIIIFWAMVCTYVLPYTVVVCQSWHQSDGMMVRSRRSVASADIVSMSRSAQSNASRVGSVSALPEVEVSDPVQDIIASSTTVRLPFDADPILDDPSLASGVVAAAMCVYIVAPTMIGIVTATFAYKPSMSILVWMCRSCVSLLWMSFLWLSWWISLMMPLHATSQLLFLGPGELMSSLILHSSYTGVGKHRPPHDEYFSFGLFVIPGPLLITQRRRLLFSSIMGDQDLVTRSRCSFFLWRTYRSAQMGFASVVASVHDVANRADLHLVGWAHRQRVPLAGPISVVLSIFVQLAAALALTSVEVLLLLSLSMASFMSRVHYSFCAWLRMSLFPMVLDLQRICSHSVFRFPVLVHLKYLRAVAGSVRHVNAPAIRHASSLSRWISEKISSASLAILAFAVKRKFHSGGYKSRRTDAYCRHASAGRSGWWRSLYVVVLAACLLWSADSSPTNVASKRPSPPPVDPALSSGSPSAAPQLSMSGTSALSLSSALSTLSLPSTIDCLAVPSAVRRAMEEAASDHHLSRDDALEHFAQCKVLEIEVVTDEVHRIVNYKRIAGQMGGLNSAKFHSSSELSLP